MPRVLPLNTLITVTTALLLSSCASLIAPTVKTELHDLKGGQYQLDPSHASIVFKVNHLGLSTYVGRFNRANATLDFDPDNLQSLKLRGLIDTASVDVNNPSLEKTLRSDEWFDAKQFPQALFQSTHIRPGEGNTFTLHGQLTIRRVTVPVVLAAQFNGGAFNLLTGRYTLGFSATGGFLRSDFGLDQYGGLVGDKIDIAIDAEFLRGNGSHKPTLVE